MKSLMTELQCSYSYQTPVNQALICIIYLQVWQVARDLLKDDTPAKVCLSYLC